MGLFLKSISVSCIMFLMNKILAAEDANDVKSYPFPPNQLSLSSRLDLAINVGSVDQPQTNKQAGNQPQSQYHVMTPGLNPSVEAAALDELKTEISAIKAVLNESQEIMAEINAIKAVLNESQERMDRAANAMFVISSPYVNQRYFLSKRGVNYQIHAAEGLCEMFGGYLAEIDDVNEFTFVREFLWSQSDSDDSFRRGAFIGGNDQAKENTFVFERSQTPVNYTAWESGYPRNYGGDKDCICLYEMSEWLMVDDDCYQTHVGYRFLCEVPLPEIS